VSAAAKSLDPFGLLPLKPPARLARVLQLLAEGGWSDYAVDFRKDRTVTIKISQADLGMLCGFSRETVNRLTVRLPIGISYVGHFGYILDIDKLIAAKKKANRPPKGEL
jgi:hypothetical protein